MNLHTHGLDNGLALCGNLMDAADGGRGEGILEQGELGTLVINLCGRQNGAGDVVDHVAGIDGDLEDIGVRGILHHAL